MTRPADYVVGLALVFLLGFAAADFYAWATDAPPVLVVKGE